jgi:hypothetical protein
MPAPASHFYRNFLAPFQFSPFLPFPPFLAFSFRCILYEFSRPFDFQTIPAFHLCDFSAILIVQQF